MLQKLQNRKDSGFTIIEVLIVLAIAGLILLIVFLAVPALQRNSRNTAIRNDVANVLSGINEYASANNGQVLAALAFSVSGSDVTIGAAPANPVQTKVRSGTTVTNSTSAPTATGAINVGINQGCTAAGTAMTPKNRAFAALFLVETGNTSTAIQCVES